MKLCLYGTSTICVGLFSRIWAEDHASWDWTAPSLPCFHPPIMSRLSHNFLGAGRVPLRIRGRCFPPSHSSFHLPRSHWKERHGKITNSCSFYLLLFILLHLSIFNINILQKKLSWIAFRFCSSYGRTFDRADKEFSFHFYLSTIEGYPEPYQTQNPDFFLLQRAILSYSSTPDRELSWATLTNPDRGLSWATPELTPDH